MKFITIICIFLTESSSSCNGSPAMLFRIPHVYSYSNQYGARVLVSNAVPERLAVSGALILGVDFDGRIYPFFNRSGEQVLVSTYDGSNVEMTPLLRSRFGHLFSPFLPRPRPGN